MRLFKTLPLSLVLFIADFTTPVEADLVPRSIQRAHRFAARHTHSLARDLRVAFGGVSRDDSSATSASNRLVYCKPKQAPFGTSPEDGGNGTGAATGTKTATSGNPSATASIPDSPWKIQQSYVRFLAVVMVWRLMIVYSPEITSSKDGISSKAVIRPMVGTPCGPCSLTLVSDFDGFQ